MDDDPDLTGSLLSRIAGFCEDVASVAALTRTATDPAAIAAMQKNLADAAALLDAVSVRITRTTNGST